MFLFIVFMQCYITFIKNFVTDFKIMILFTMFKDNTCNSFYLSKYLPISPLFSLA